MILNNQQRAVSMTQLGNLNTAIEETEHLIADKEPHWSKELRNISEDPEVGKKLLRIHLEALNSLKQGLLEEIAEYDNNTKKENPA